MAHSTLGKYFTQFDALVPFDFIRVRKYAYSKSTNIGCECMELPDYLQMVSKDLQVSTDIVTRATQFSHDPVQDKPLAKNCHLLPTLKWRITAHVCQVLENLSFNQLLGKDVSTLFDGFAKENINVVFV